MMTRARCAKTGRDIDRDYKETRWADGNGNSKGDEQVVRSANITNRDGNPNARTDARTGDRQLQKCNSPRQLRRCISDVHLRECILDIHR